jgi:hypothetical protein
MVVLGRLELPTELKNRIFLKKQLIKIKIMRLEFKLGGANNDHITNSYMASGADGIFYGDE